jgi:hypothetical protein
MKRSSFAAFAIGASFALPQLGHCETAPAPYRGKSITFSWTEARLQRRVGTANWQSATESYTVNAYFSSTGRVFARLKGDYERTPDQGVGAPNAHFGDHSFVSYFQGSKVTRVRRFSVSFNRDYTTCGLQVTSAKPSGSDVSLMRNGDNGQMTEARSITITATSCSVREGNVFGQ